MSVQNGAITGTVYGSVIEEEGSEFALFGLFVQIPETSWADGVYVDKDGRIEVAEFGDYIKIIGPFMFGIDELTFYAGDIDNPDKVETYSLSDLTVTHPPYTASVPDDDDLIGFGSPNQMLASDMQSNIVIGDGVITGTLYECDNVLKDSDNPTTGYFLTIYLHPASFVAQINGEYFYGQGKLEDNTEVIVLEVTDLSDDVSVVYAGSVEEEVATYDISGLTLVPKE